MRIARSTGDFKPIVASCWAIFHTALAVTAIRRSLWPEDRRYSYRHTVHLPVEFGDAEEYIARGLGCTTDLSENGIGLILYLVLWIYTKFGSTKNKRDGGGAA